MTPDYPRTFDEIGDWAKRRGVRAAEARTRFAQYGVLRAVATSRTLGQTLAFKGGNALDFIWQPNRSTTDLDFSLAGDPLAADQLRNILQRSLAATGRLLNLGYNVQSIKPWTLPAGKTFITYEARIGYAFPDEYRPMQQLQRGAPLSRIVSVDISINEVICATEDVPLAPGAMLCVCTLEDIIAEKLRSLLQQPIRRRDRAQDALDIAVCLTGMNQHNISAENVAAYLISKSRARGVAVSRAAFQNPEIWERAGRDYPALESFARDTFVTFDDARSQILHFVKLLDIPAE